MFKLYPTEQHWWSFDDYRAVKSTVERLGVRRALEFGPGSSTLAIVEGGARSVDTCEDSLRWADVYRSRLVARFPKVVKLHLYEWAERPSIPAVDGERFDYALVDGPRITENRPAVIRYSLERCTFVHVCLEESGPDRPGFLRPRVEALAQEFGVPLAVETTGPLAGAFALLGPTR